MIKSSYSKNLLILEIFSVLIVCLFLTTLLTPSFGNSETGSNAIPSLDVHSIHRLSYNNNFSNALEEKVIYTLVLSNNTLINGNVIGRVNGPNPRGITYDTNNGYVYVAVKNCTFNNVSVINGTTNKVVKNITVGSSPKGVSVNSNNGYVYVTNCGSDNVSVINGTTNKVVKSITVGRSPNGISFDSNNENFYVANDCSNNVSVINGTTNKVVKNIMVGSAPKGVSVNSNNGYVYVTNHCSNNISVINGTTNKVVKSITVGSYPNGVSFDSENGYVYVANTFTSSISIIGVMTYKVTFSESGLPTGDLWYVNITGQTSSNAIDAGSSFTIDLTNETYSYTVANVSGYSVTPSSGSILVKGAGISKTFTFTTIRKQTSTTGLSNADLYSIAGGISAAAAIGSVAIIMIRRRK